MSDFRDRLNGLLIDKFALKPDTLAADPTLESLDFDSLSIVKLVTAMEREFGVEVDEDELSEHTTVGDIVELLEDRLSAARLGQVRALRARYKPRGGLVERRQDVTRAAGPRTEPGLLAALIACRPPAAPRQPPPG
jgi:acyl carrier protein